MFNFVSVLFFFWRGNKSSSSGTVQVVILFSQLANILTFENRKLCPKKLPQPVMFKKLESSFFLQGVFLPRLTDLLLNYLPNLCCMLRQTLSVHRDAFLTKLRPVTRFNIKHIRRVLLLHQIKSGLNKVKSIIPSNNC